MRVATWADAWGVWHARVTADAETADAPAMAAAAAAAITAEIHQRSNGSPAALAWRARVQAATLPSFWHGHVSVEYREWPQTAGDTPSGRAAGARLSVEAG